MVSRMGWGKGCLMLWVLTGCTAIATPQEKLNLQLYQQWQLQPGDQLGGYRVVGGLGDISIALNGNSVYAPFNGRAQQDQRNCLVFSSPDVPAYLFRICGIGNMSLGPHNQGEVLGDGAIAHFATLRKQPNGTWAIVEPSKPVLERLLTRKF
jgi:hypothetical protein